MVRSSGTKTIVTRDKDPTGLRGVQKRFDQEVGLGGRPSTSLTEIKLLLKKGTALTLNLIGSELTLADALALEKAMPPAPDGHQILCGEGSIDVARGVITGAPFKELELTAADAALIRASCWSAGVQTLELELGHSLPIKSLTKGPSPPLSTCRITADDMPLLCGLMALDRSKAVTKLDLPANQFGDDGAITLARQLATGALPGLLCLNLSANNLSDVAVEELAAAAADGGMARLVELHLGSNPSISNDGLSALGYNARGGASFRELQTLELSGCSIGSSGVEALADDFAEGAMPSLQASHLHLL